MRGAAEVRDGLLEEARAAGRPLAAFWEPAAPLVVLGRAGDAERECDLARCRARGVPVVKRRGGGGTVVLASGMLVLTMAGAAGSVVRPRRAFDRINAWVAGVVRAAGGPELAPRGTSDLCVGDRKVLGSSLAFAGGHALYQAALLVDPDLDLVAALLRHPPREPGYRRGRSHGDFLTSLARAGFAARPADLAQTFERRFAADPPLPLDPSPSGDPPR